MTLRDDPRAGVVYALLDPRDGRRRYIGKTVKPPEKRRRQHVTHAMADGRGHCSRWVQTLLAQDLEPLIEVLEEVPEGIGLLSAAEQQWISTLKAEGADLCNQTTGGDGGDTWTGRRHTAEARAKMSARVKAAPPSRAEKIAAYRRKQWEDPEYRAKMTEAGRRGGSAGKGRRRGQKSSGTGSTST